MKNKFTLHVNEWIYITCNAILYILYYIPGKIIENILALAAIETVIIVLRLT